MISPIAPSRTTRMLAGLPVADMLHQLTGAAYVNVLQTDDPRGAQAVAQPIRSGVRRNHLVVYHAQSGDQFGARALSEKLAFTGQHDYHKRPRQRCQFPHVSRQQHVEVPDRYRAAGGRPIGIYDLASCVHAEAVSFISSLAALATRSLDTRIMQR